LGERRGVFEPGRIPFIFPADQGIDPEGRVRGRLYPPPSSLGSQRFPPYTCRQSESFSRFRGVLEVGSEHIWTDERDFRSDETRRPAFLSVGNCGGPDL